MLWHSSTHTLQFSLFFADFWWNLDFVWYFQISNDEKDDFDVGKIDKVAFQKVVLIRKKTKDSKIKIHWKKELENSANYAIWNKFHLTKFRLNKKIEKKNNSVISYSNLFQPIWITIENLEIKTLEWIREFVLIINEWIEKKAK